MIKFRQFVALQESDEFAPIQEMLEGFLTTEEFEQLNEISKETLKSYVKKAKPKLAGMERKITSDFKKISGATDWSPGSPAMKAAARTNSISQKFENRRKGIALATKRLSESFLEELMLDEDFQALDEVSKELLGRYLEKAVTSHHVLKREKGYTQRSINTGKANKVQVNGKTNHENFHDLETTVAARERGIAHAEKRLRDLSKATQKLTECPKEFWAPLFESDEFQQLQELSKKTLGSYIMHATQSYADAQGKRDKYREHADTVSRMDHNLDQSARGSVRSADDALRKAANDHDRRRQKRGMGVMRALKRLTTESVMEMLELDEEFQQLDELSKKTLGNYINNAHNDAMVQKDKATSLYSMARQMSGDEARNEYASRAAIRAKKFDNRNHGILRAVKKLSEEELYELSKKTLSSYIKKATPQLRSAAQMKEFHRQAYHDAKTQTDAIHHDKREDEFRRMANKREDGITMAASKLAEATYDPKETQKALDWHKKYQKAHANRAGHTEGYAAHATAHAAHQAVLDAYKSGQTKNFNVLRNKAEDASRHADDVTNKLANGSVHESVLNESRFDNRTAATHHVIHPDMAQYMKVGDREADFYHPSNGDKKSGEVLHNDMKTVRIKHEGKVHAFKVSKHYPGM